MKISITSRSSAKIYLSTADMQQLGLSLAELEQPSDEARLFISAIAAFLTSLGLIALDGAEFDCKVSEVFDGAVTEISAVFPRTEESTCALFAFKDDKELTGFCNALSPSVLKKLRSCALYKHGSVYCLVAEFDLSKASILAHPHLQGAVFDEVQIEKTREYGKLLSHTPIKTIRELNSP